MGLNRIRLRRRVAPGPSRRWIAWYLQQDRARQASTPPVQPTTRDFNPDDFNQDDFS